MGKKPPSSEKAPKPKKNPPNASKAASSSSGPSLQETGKDQQHILSIFRTAFSATLADDSLPSLLQSLKTALFNRDFGAAFGRAEYLDAYAARWSPTRALGYADVLGRVGGPLGSSSL